MHTSRRLIQFAFLVLVIVGVFVLQKHCEWWCPFGAVEGIHAYTTEGSFPCSLGATNLFAFGGLIVSVVLIRRAFCGYLCPIGILSDWFHSLGRLLRLPRFDVPKPLDRVLSFLKYPILVLIIYFTIRLQEVIFHAFCPAYAAISRHGEDITFWAYTVLGGTMLLSLVLTMPFCRWFCPLAAVMNPISRFGVTRVRRDTATCIDCGKCARTCPMAIPVDKVQEASAARCISCLECVEACPKRKDGALTWGPPARVGAAWPGIALVGILAVCFAGTVVGAIWFPLASFTKTQGTEPEEVATVELTVENCACRGNANLLWYFLTRDDDYALSKYIKLEAWPSPRHARVRVTYDPAVTTDDDVKMAIVEPYLELEDLYMRNSPFKIEGFNPMSAYVPDVPMPELDF